LWLPVAILIQNLFGLPTKVSINRFDISQGQSWQSDLESVIVTDASVLWTDFTYCLASVYVTDCALDLVSAKISDTICRYIHMNLNLFVLQTITPVHASAHMK